MSPDHLRRLHRQFTALVVVGLALTPVAGLGAARAFGLVAPGEVAAVLGHGLLPAFLGVMLLWSAFHFHRYLAPLIRWLGEHGDGAAAPQPLHRRLARFPREYWSLFLLYSLACPLLFAYGLWGAPAGWAMDAFAHFLLVQLTVTILIGLPTYLLTLDRLGHLVARLGLTGVQVSIKSKIMLLVGFVPLLSYSVLMHYHWLRTGGLSGELAWIWAALALVTTTVAVLSSRSMDHALRPVQEVLTRSGASTHAELAGLRPRSTDEIGYLTQTLARLFRRLGDQESHMRTVVETAAEGIIVVDEQGLIHTYNPAAEQLFGFLAHEIQGQPLTWLLPDYAVPKAPPPLTQGELEVEGQHRNGKPIPLSLRVSRMQISGRTMYTCLVADITKRKSAEEQLRSAEARYRDLVETAHDLVWAMDPEGHWSYLNRASKGIYGLEPDEMVGRHIREFEVHRDGEPRRSVLEEILEGRELFQFETVHRDTFGETHHLSFNGKAHLDDDGHIVHISGTARDITQQKAFQQQLSYQAEHDSLTTLFNRHYFQQELERTVARVARNGATCALLYIDLDQFKYINDTLGHAAGDQLLVEVSRMIASHVREGDLFARFGGDEFTLLLYNIAETDVHNVAEHFRRLFEEYKFFYDNKSFNVSSSIGVAFIDRHVVSADEVLSHADLACNMAKTQGRNRIHLYDPADRDKAGMAEDMGWAARVREMLEQDRFKLVYQPIACVADGTVRDYEVLVRMLCDDGEVILPGGFMPAAERFGLIHGVDRWIVRRAMHELSELRAQGRQVRFSINLSGKAFEDKQLLPLIQSLLHETGLDPAWVTFEITETAAIANLTAATGFITALKGIGCQFALDDFGSGFCSFTYLKHLPVDKLKIDGSFVQGLAQQSVDQAMVESMNQVAHALGKQTIAEYVENEETLTLLRGFGVDYAQGNHIGQPRDSVPSPTRPTLVAGTSLSQ